MYPLQKILQDSRSAQGTFANPEGKKASRPLVLQSSRAFWFLTVHLLSGSLVVKFSVHRALVVLKAIVLSISEASAVSRTVAFEGLKSLLPLVQEYFEVYKDDHGKTTFWTCVLLKST